MRWLDVLAASVSRRSAPPDARVGPAATFTRRAKAPKEEHGTGPISSSLTIAETGSEMGHRMRLSGKSTTAAASQHRR